MDYNKKTENQIAEEAKIIEISKQNPEAFEVLYNSYFSQVFAFIYNRTTDKQITADITSQVFLKAMINLQKYQNKGLPFSAWLFRIAINEISTFYNQTKRLRSVSIDKIGADLFGQSIETDLGEDKLPAILKIIETLPEKSVRIIELRFFENRSYKEIADLLNISVSNAKVKVHRILKKVKKQIPANLLFIILLFMYIAKSYTNV